MVRPYGSIIGHRADEKLTFAFSPTAPTAVAVIIDSIMQIPGTTPYSP